MPPLQSTSWLLRELPRAVCPGFSRRILIHSRYTYTRMCVHFYAYVCIHMHQTYIYIHVARTFMYYLTGLSLYSIQSKLFSCGSGLRCRSCRLLIGFRIAQPKIYYQFSHSYYPTPPFYHSDSPIRAFLFPFL